MDKPKYRHIDRDGCGKVAFYLLEMYSGMVLSPSKVILLNGKHPEPGDDYFTCGSCGSRNLLLASRMVEEND